MSQIEEIRERAELDLFWNKHREQVHFDRDTLLGALAARDTEIEQWKDADSASIDLGRRYRDRALRAEAERDRLWAQVQDAAKAGWCPCCDSRPQHCRPELWPNSKRHGLNEAQASTRAALNVGGDTAAQPTSWRDSQGDVWTEGTDGLMHSPETRPFSREHIERKWGPLTAVDLDDKTRWVCRRCHSNHWVSISLNGGATMSAQCVPCGQVQTLPDTATHDEGTAPFSISVWKDGDPCAACGSTDTHLIQDVGVPIAACRNCGAADDDE